MSDLLIFGFTWAVASLVFGAVWLAGMRIVRGWDHVDSE